MAKGIVQFWNMIVITLLASMSACTTERKSFFPRSNHRWYTELFTQISENLNNKHETRRIFNEFQFQFYQEINRIAESVKPLKADLSRNPNIKNGVRSQNKVKALATEAYGDGSDLMSREKKVIICGAKGKVVNENNTKTIKILALGEVMHPSAGAIVAGYASVQENGFVDFDIKINDNYRSKSKGSMDEFVVSKIVSNKILLNEKKIAIASSSIYILSLGLDFVKFTVYHLIVGISIKSHAVYSQSIIDMEVYIASKTDGLESHEGVFASTNECSFSTACVTKHYGFLKVDHNRAKRIQNTLGKSVVIPNATKSLVQANFKGN